MGRYEPSRARNGDIKPMAGIGSIIALGSKIGIAPHKQPNKLGKDATTHHITLNSLSEF